jgi:hypothetical protein
VVGAADHYGRNLDFLDRWLISRLVILINLSVFQIFLLNFHDITFKGFSSF